MVSHSTAPCVGVVVLVLVVVSVWQDERNVMETQKYKNKIFLNIIFSYFLGRCEFLPQKYSNKWDFTTLWKISTLKNLRKYDISEGFGHIVFIFGVTYCISIVEAYSSDVKFSSVPFWLNSLIITH
jgi:hypothetical protein